MTVAEINTEIAVIGSGLVGAAVAYDLQRAGYRVLVLEAASEPAAGASRSNSGVLHTGFDSPPGTFETRLIRDQAARWPAVFRACGIPYLVPGALLLARDEEEARRLPEIARQATLNGVPTRLLDAADTRAAEPGVRAAASLHVPGEAITDPWAVATRLLHGTELRLNWPVETAEADGDGVRLRGAAGEVRAHLAVNCAGLFADELLPEDFTVTPRRGEFVVYPPGSADLTRHILLPLPSAYTKGVLVFPTLSGHLCAGPTAEDQTDKRDWTPREDALRRLHAQAQTVLPALAALPVADAWAGLRPVGHPQNFICHFSGRVPNLLHLAGVRSTGLSCCLGLSAWALGPVMTRRLPGGAGSALPPLPPEDGPPWWDRLNRLRNIAPIRSPFP